MPTDKTTEQAIKSGLKRAEEVLEFRAKRVAMRADLSGVQPRARTRAAAGGVVGEKRAPPNRGVLVAEGDSWFSYPLHDVIAELEDRHGYDVESVAHAGDRIEQMAYGGGQLEELTRRLEKLIGRGTTPKAVLLSGGGNDVAGAEFGMLLNHADSAIAGLNSSIVDGVVNQRIRLAYLTILSAVTAICKQKTGNTIPILVHGYDYPVPDGRGFLGGWGPLPGPWLEPGFREKGYEDLARRKQVAHELIEIFNVMVEGIPALAEMSHVHYVDLRNTLQTGATYKRWWANELHPTETGFRVVAERFEAVLRSLP